MAKNKCNTKQFHYVYRITDKTTGEFYIGSRTSKVLPEQDSYMGSMCIWKPNKDNLTKEILFKEFITRKECTLKESEIISSCIKNPLNRNYHIPGGATFTYGLVKIRDTEGNTRWVSNTDPKFLNGEYTHINTGLTRIFNPKTGEKKRLRDQNLIKNFLSEGWEIGIGYKPTKDKKHMYDPKSGERKMVSVSELEDYKDRGWLEGFNREESLFVHNESKYILVKKSELNSYIEKGWKLGSGNPVAKNTIWINHPILKKTRMINPEELGSMISLGWERGRRNSKKEK